MRGEEEQVDDGEIEIVIRLSILYYRYNRSH
jgi:hypothetical protein